MDFSKLSMSDKLVSVGAIIAIIATFLPWYSWSMNGFGISGSVSASLWDTSGGMAFLILATSVVAIAVIILRVTEVFDLSEQGVPEALVILIAAAITALFTLFRLASIPGGAGAFGLGRSWGLWIGLAGAVVFAVGAAIKFQEERA